MTMQPTTTGTGFKNECCSKHENMDWINGDGIAWEEFVCLKCNLSYTVPIERIFYFDNAELVESSLEDEIKPHYRWPLTKKNNNDIKRR